MADLSLTEVSVDYLGFIIARCPSLCGILRLRHWGLAQMAHQLNKSDYDAVNEFISTQRAGITLLLRLPVVYRYL